MVKALDKTEMLENLKRNWYFPLSAMAYFALCTSLTPEFVLGMGVSFVILVLVSARVSSIWVLAKKQSAAIHLLSMAAAVSVCLSCNRIVQFHWTLTDVLVHSKLLGPIAYGPPLVTSLFLFAPSFLFVYLCNLLFWKNLTGIAKRTGVFRGIRTAEWAVYGLLFVLTMGLVVFSFTQTDAFYGTGHTYDIIYTSDSPSLVKGNVYHSLTFAENDFRQALFAVFSAPFTGMAYLAAWLIRASASVQAILLNSVQVAMMLAANLMLARALQFDALKRICFMVLTSCTYTYLLFSLMMEQYIVSYFWLILCVYIISENGRLDRIALWGAGGTLLTSSILLPFMSEKSAVKDFKAWFADMVKYGVEFVVFQLACCRLDAFCNIAKQWEKIGSFTGSAVPFVDKLYQYMEFVVNCFAAPNAEVSTKIMYHISWQLADITRLNFVGAAIVLLAVISAVLNRGKKSSMLAAGWMGFSFFVLVVMGWGTSENGLILYSLYFGWALMVLLLQLIEKIENVLNVKHLLPAIMIAASAALFAVNFPAIMEMVDFAAAHFPV